MMKILMVCLGNICRSPLAEGILKSKVSEAIFIDSAGTAAYHVGNLPDVRSIEVALKHGIDISQQRARKFTEKDFDDFDLIYAMDQSNYQDIIALSRTKEDRQKAQLILNEINTNANQDVPDPYYGEDNGFENVYQMLDEACEVIASKIQ
ncbi:MAG: low molecular weight phosphotyrosine protein phosphatase [Polaribacter sp.]|nr:low molecular weight phosphotyrosine protein phosphatase [Polaribacter sp.]MDG1811448.1 low molecular weight phosphotyrosine protein phosphatase [Polaribacter sp.]MDG1994586.1 low molecular weight phosphotyrosine protein phosphatase [Polaribacter sp.]